MGVNDCKVWLGTGLKASLHLGFLGELACVSFVLTLRSIAVLLCATPAPPALETISASRADGSFTEMLGDSPHGPLCVGTRHVRDGGPEFLQASLRGGERG